MPNRSRQLFLPLILACALGGTLPPAALQGTADSESIERRERLRGAREEIARLQQELDGLVQRERGVLGQLERLGAELRLREAESTEVGLRLDGVTSDIAERDRRLAELTERQDDRRVYLQFRLRELYKAGQDQTLRRFVGGRGVEDYWDGLRYAAFLSDRDLRVIRGFRATRVRLVEENRALAEKQQELIDLQADLQRKRSAIRSGRRRRERLLVEIREDQGRRQAAIRELESAAQELTRVVDDLQPPTAGMDMRKFRGLLDWPADGPVSNGFGQVIHPRFKTKVPHPGLDIAGDYGADIRNVFDGEVVFAAWMRGYGLTAIIDHGGGLLSIYAHASVLLVEPGEECRRGQVLGKIGDSGSLRGPFLYFELRVDGEPTDPAQWLRRR